MFSTIQQEKNGGHPLLKLKLRLFLSDCIVAMVTCYMKRMITTCLPMIGQLCDTIIDAH